MATPPQPIDIASAIADLTPIDWSALEADAAQPIDRAMLKRLRLLDRVVRACADTGTHGASAETAPAPATWGPFVIHEPVGHGTFGSVYRAHDRRLDRIVALKLLRPERDGGAAVESEAIHEGRLLAKVRHPNVVTVYGAERMEGRVGVWMEYIDGRTLEDELRQTGPLPPDAVVQIGLTLCGALIAVHESGLLHRDLKAQNVMRSRDGRILLTDFGAGRAVADVPSDQRPELAGTPLYLAPEVLTGAPASIGSELYSLGVLLYHLATGSFPVRGRTLRELKDAHAAGTRVSIRAYRDKLPRALVNVIDRAVHHDPSQRFGSVEELAAALEPLKRRVPGLRLTVLTTLVAVALTLGGFNLWWSSHPPLEVVDMKVVRRDPGTGALLLFVKDGLLYYRVGDTIYSSPPDPDAAAEIKLPNANIFQPDDINPTRDEFLAEKIDTNTKEGSELWAVGSKNGQNRQIIGVRGSTASYSQDGLRIAYVSDGRLYVANRDGTASRQIRGTPSDEIGWPRWSPSGEWLRFNVRRRDRFIMAESIWEARTDGTGLHEFRPGWNDPPAEAHGRFSPDGSFFVFRSRIEHNDLWAVRERTHILDWTRKIPIRLTTSGSVEFDGGAIVDRDNRTLYATGGHPEGQLVRYDQQRRVFEPYLGGISATWIAMSRDQREFVYVSYPDNKLWRSSVDGTVKTLLDDSPAQVDGAMWSPDGKWISFASRRDGVHLKIFLLRADNSGPAMPLTANDEEQGFPSWSRDGRQFVFGDVPPLFGEATGNEVLHLHDMESGETTVIPHSRGFWTARWSPDGRSIAAVTVRPPYQLVLFDVQKQSWRPVPEAQHVDNPTWSHDSRLIYYDTEGKYRTLSRVDVTTGHVEMLRSLMDYATVAYGWSGLAPDDSPLVLHNIGTGQIYALTLGRK